MKKKGTEAACRRAAQRRMEHFPKTPPGTTLQLADLSAVVS
jgi:hypothetical protein